MAESTVEHKRRLRAGIRSSRRARTDDERRAAADSLATHLATLTESVDADWVTCYLSSPTEPGTRPYLAWARDHGVRTLLPVSESDGLLDWVEPQFDAEGMLHETTGMFSVPEPIGPRHGADAVTRADLLLVPAAAVDATGARLGWGKGYYDRALTLVAADVPIYAVVFDDEVLTHVPRESHDRAVSGFVAPRGIIQVC